MKNKPLDSCLSREQALALDAFVRHPGLRIEGLAFVGFVSVSAYALAAGFVRRLTADLPFAVQPVADIAQLNRICREGKSDCVYVILCNAFRAPELEQWVYPALSLYRDFIFERRLKHIYVGNAGFLAAAHQRLPDLFLIHQAVLPLENLRTLTAEDLSLPAEFFSPEPSATPVPERLNPAVCLAPPAFDRSAALRRAAEWVAPSCTDSPYTMALRYLRLSVLYLRLQAFEKAGVVLEKAASLAAATGSREFVEAVELHRAFGLLCRGKCAEAASAFRDFLETGSRRNSPAICITAWGALGESWRQLNRPQEALGCFRRALGLSREAGLAMLEALMWVKIGEMAAWRADYPAARRAYRRALAGYTSGRSRIAVAYTLLNLGDTYRATDDWAFAKVYYRQALTLFEAAGLRVGKLAASVCMAKCELDKAEAGGKWASDRISRFLGQAGRWAGEEKELAWQVEIDICQGRLARLRQDVQATGAAFRRALGYGPSFTPQYERQKRVAYGYWGSGYAATWPRLSEATVSRETIFKETISGETISKEAAFPPSPAEALRFLTEARLYFERTADTANRILIYRFLGDFYQRNADFEQALAYYSQALELARAAGSLSRTAAVQEAKGKLYAARGEEAEARKQLSEARRLRQLIGASRA